MWFQLVARRLLSAVPTLFVMSILAFSLIRLVPGDPVTIMLGERGASPAVVGELRSRLGLDRSFGEQYFLFIQQILRGDFGVSITSQQPVLKEFKALFPATVELSCLALFAAIVLGVPMGVWAASRRNSWVDHVVTSLSLFGYSIPIFWWGLILILVFSVGLGWTPVAGRISAIYEIEPRTGFYLLDSWFSGGWPVFQETLRHLLLPAAALSTLPLAAIARMTRSSLLNVLREDYIRTAHAKGLSRRRVILHHALRNALIPIVTVMGLMGSTLLTGAILTETIFAWPGVGRWLVQSVTARDYPVLQGGLLLLCAVVVIINFLVDLAHALLNPMVRSYDH